MNNTVTLCGSTRFLPQFAEALKELSVRGFSVLTLSQALPKNEPDDGARPQGEQDLKVMLDLVYLNHILRSDGILVLGDGYVGRSTAREIVWARMQGRCIVDQSGFLRGGAPMWDAIASALRDGGWCDNALVARALKVMGLP